MSSDVMALLEKDAVEEEPLRSLLKLSVDNENLRLLLLDILFLIEPSSITDAVLNDCICYPDEYRETLLVQLAHMWLTERQLEVIHKEIETPEAFCKLFSMYSENENCDLKQYEDFLTKNISHVREVDCLEMIYVHKIKISAAKKAALCRLLKQ